MPYTQAQKLAYYRKLAQSRSRQSSTRSRQAPYRGYGSYRRSYYGKGSKIQAKKNYKISKQVSKGMAELGGYAGTAIGAGLGSVGGPMGSAIGSALGGIAGYGLASIMGYGKYKIKKNVYMEGRLPQVMNIPKAGGTVIRFQEYLGDIYTTADIGDPAKFNIQSFLINAANQDTFPWLAQIAQNYEQYSFEGLLFHFRSTSADALNSTNTALGSVMLATQYDVADPLFRTKTEMLNYEYSNSVKPSENCTHMIECAPGQTPVTELYTLDGAAPSGTDSRFYHLGRFCIATVGFQAANVNIGELHVTYQVRLLKPKLYATLGNGSDFAYISSTTYSNASPLSGTWSLSPESNFAVSVSSGTFTLPVSSVIKSYRIQVLWSGAGAVLQTLANPTVANCTLVQCTLVTQGATGQQAEVNFQITTLGNSKTASFSFSGLTLPTSPNFAAIRVCQVPQAVTL